MRLKRPRLLPATIAAMSALLLLKSVMLVQAAAEEPAAAAEAAPASRAPVHGAATASAAVPSAAPSGARPSAASAPEAAALTPGAPLPAAREAAAPPMSESERSVLMSLRERREQLEARAHALDQRAADLEAADHRLEERVRQLAALQARLEGLEADRQSRRAENWAGLVKTYEAMKPREAAAIFDALDMQVLLQVLDRMQERRAAPVLAAMQPDRARLATQLLAELRTRATTLPEAAPPTIPVPKS